MKSNALKIIIFICLSFFTFNTYAGEKPAETAFSPKGDYTVGPGDILEIAVWKDEAMTKTVPVLPDGKITLPLIGDCMAGGKTLKQIKGELESRISRYVPDPIMTVSVIQVNSMMVYVIGKVNHSGRYQLTSNVNVLQALSMAGGLSPFAKRNDIKIFREENEKTNIMEFSYDDVTDGTNLAMNIRLKKGDIIVVP